jgi:hypothetical protein
MSDILQKYEGLGGAAALGTRSIELPTEDGRGSYIATEGGDIYWSPDSGSHIVMNAILAEWRRFGGIGGRLGYPITDELSVPWGSGRMSFFQGGAIYWAPGLGCHAVWLDAPQLGNPAFVAPGTVLPITLKTGSSMAFAAFARRTGPGLAMLWDGRLYLRRVGQKEDDFDPATWPIRLTPRVEVEQPGEELLITFDPPPRLGERALYDLCFISPEGETYAIAPHSAYARSTWSSFGFAHITDLHVSRRIDGFAGQLRQLGFDEGAVQLSNCNDKLRTFVRAANRLHAMDRLDAVLATGDLVDYFREDDDPGTLSSAAGNFGLLEDILRGRSPFSDGSPAEELRIPILTTLGNHDYRVGAYPLIGDVARGGIALSLLDQQAGFNLTLQEAVAMVGGSWSPEGIPLVPDIHSAVEKNAVAISESLRSDRSFYARRFSRQRSFVSRIGPHRIAMLDTGPDAGVTTDAVDAFIGAVIGGGSEDTRQFLSGTPNCEGLEAAEIALVRMALAEAGPGGLVLVGMHAPPLNLKNDEYNYFFRETEHDTANPLETAAFLVRHGAIRRPEWFEWNRDPGGAADWPRMGTKHFKAGRTGQLLDHGVARGLTNEFLHLCAGAEGRKVDLVLFGHVHRHVEFRVSRDQQGTLHYFTDHYTMNPAEYYASRAIENGDVRQSRSVRVFVDGPVDPALGTHRIDATGSFEAEWRRAVPRNPDTLNESPEANLWWDRHRPLLLQSAPLGPVDSNQRPDRDVKPMNGVVAPNQQADRPNPTFQGWRLLSVVDGTISNITVVPA